MGRDLVVIESPGKMRTLYAVFAKIGLHADICATFGHFLENPPSLNELGIQYRDGQFIENHRTPHRADSFAYLRDRLRKCEGRVLIATDNDQEGHVIAQDVAELAKSLGVRRPVFRMVFSGIDVDSVRTGLQHLTPLDSTKAVPGTARRIADRIIGGCLSDFRDDRPVGRVQSALLGLASEGLEHSTITIKMPAADGGSPFLGCLPVRGQETPADLIARLGAHELPPAPVGSSDTVPMATGLNFGDALIACNRSLGLDIEEAAALLQQMYEDGALSYPRTRAREFTEAGADAIDRLAKLNGLHAFRRTQVAILNRRQNESPHEAIRVLDESLYKRIQLGKPMKLQATRRDAVLTLIARSGLETGIVVRREAPNLSCAPKWARAVDWSRDARPILPWRRSHGLAVVKHDPKAAIVQTMMATGLGRPSTWPLHAAKMLSRSFLDGSLNLTHRGRAVLAFTPPALKDVSTSRDIEASLDREDAEVSELVMDTLRKALANDHALIGKVLEQLETNNDEETDELVARLRL